MTKLASRERFKDRVVLGIRRRDHRMLWMRELEKYSLKSRGSRGIQVFDDFYYRCRIKPAEPLIPVHQGTLNQVESGLLPFRELIELEFLLRNLQRAPRDIHAKNGLELLVGEQVAEQLAFTAAKIKMVVEAFRSFAY